MKPATIRPLCGIVLAGGHSVRMGMDKAALVHQDGRTLARRCHDLLVEAGCATIVLSLRHDQDIPPGFEGLTAPSVIRDPAGGSEGPLVGMLSAMRVRPDADWLVLACDLPRLDLASMNHLLSSRLAGELFLSYRSEFDGLPEPLCALYAAGALALLQQAQADGIRCPRKVLIRHDCRLLEPVSPRALDNANTPEDWETARQP